MVVLEAEAAIAVAEALADNVAGCVFSPPLRVSPGNYLGVCPASVLRLFVEESWSLLTIAAATSRTRRRRRRSRTHLFLAVIGQPRQLVQRVK